MPTDTTVDVGRQNQEKPQSCMVPAFVKEEARMPTDAKVDVGRQKQERSQSCMAPAFVKEEARRSKGILWPEKRETAKISQRTE